MNDFERKYITEAGLRIRHEGFTVCEEKEGLLPIEWASSRVCNVNGKGGMTYDPKQIRREGLSGDYRLQDGTLWQGHYFDPGEGMDAAKRDFTTRSGLIPSSTDQERCSYIDFTRARACNANCRPFFIVHGRETKK